ncbi:MAG TPA: hypothetical protein VM243_10580 [Phycisphaerae bacterium]|nr:hypothetical protein [Phycisphaerae bacterium]
MMRAWMITGCLLLAVPSGRLRPAEATGIDFIVHQDGTPTHTLVVARPALVDEPYPIPLEEVVELPGYYLTAEPGWDGLGVDQPEEGRLALLTDTGLTLRRVSFDPGFEMFDLDLNPILETDGATVRLEGEAESEEFAWHQHLVFGVEPGAEVGQEYTATFVLIDEEGDHGDSEPFTLRFVTTAAAGAGAGTGGACASGGGACGAMGMICLVLTVCAMVRMKGGVRRAG